MVRTLALTVCLAAAPAWGQVAPQAVAEPSARAVPAVPATRPSLEQLHAQAYEFLAAGKFDRASEPFNRAYNETPPAKRSRALVLNRAIIDLVQKQNVVRGVKDLCDYLAQNPQPDEQASNVLGASLDLVADNPKWRQGPVYASALREFARREAALERSRPGFRRWGDQWIAESKLDEIKEKQKELAAEAEAAYAGLDRRTKDLQAITVQYDNARKQFGGFRTHAHLSRNGATPYRADCPVCMAYLESRESVNALSRDMEDGKLRVKQADAAYRALQRRQVKPTWPKRFAPIDPSAPPPAPPESPGPAVTPFGLDATPAATQPTTTQPAATPVGSI